MDFKKIERLMKLLKANELHEIEVTDGDERIRVTAHSTGGALPTFVSAPSVSAPAPASVSSDAAAGDVSAPMSSGKQILSPFVGTFYRSSSPGADPFVSVGQRVKKGDVLCIVEAMKLMNEIEAEENGVIVEILVENEQPVEYNQPLFVFE